MSGEATPGRDEERAAWVGLARAVGPGNAGVDARVRRSGPVAVWSQLRGQYPDVVPERDLDPAGPGGIRVLCPGDDEWPAGLAGLNRGGAREDGGEPYALWVRGTASPSEVLARAVAVVGARDATQYGQFVARDIAATLADRGWTTVSGAAFGIDAAAHRGALAGGGCTVAVLAGGVDIAYPRAHEELLDRIVARGGLVVSESPPGEPPYRHRFLSRNRVVAGLSAGTVIVEAGVRSGALNTARHTRRLGRPLMVVPGPVTSRASTGCHDLLRAHREEVALVTSGLEVLEEVGPVGELAERSRPEPGPRDGLEAAVRRVLDAVPARDPAGPAVIAQAVRERPEVVLAILGPLAAQGLVERCPDGYRLTALGRAPSAGPRPRSGR